MGIIDIGVKVLLAPFYTRVALETVSKALVKIKNITELSGI